MISQPIAKNDVDTEALARTPTELSIITNETCNLKCLTCFAWQTKERKIISTEDIKRVMNELKEWLGDVPVNIVGGEPFIRPDMVEILDYAKSLEMRTMICTNGSLIGEREAQCLAQSCHGINISLNAMDPEIHDYTRGYKGSHELIMRSISLLKKHLAQVEERPWVNLSTIFSDYNKEEMLPLLYWARENDITISYQGVSAPYWREYDHRWKEKSKFWPRTEESCERIREIIDAIIDLKNCGFPVSNTDYQLRKLRDYFFPVRSATTQAPHIDQKTINAMQTLPPETYCQIGYHNLSINFHGEVKICHGKRPIGSIYSGDSLKDLWISHSAADLRKDISVCTKDCKILNCNSKE